MILVFDCAQTLPLTFYETHALCQIVASRTKDKSTNPLIVKTLIEDTH